jgi:hypothetical protein
MADRQQFWYTVMGVAGIGAVAYMRRRNPRQALGDTIAQLAPRLRTNNPMLDQALGQMTDEAIEQLMAEPVDDDPEYPFAREPKVVKLTKPTQASGWHDTRVPIKDAEFTPVDPKKDAR